MTWFPDSLPTVLFKQVELLVQVQQRGVGKVTDGIPRRNGLEHLGNGIQKGIDRLRPDVVQDVLDFGKGLLL